MSLGIDRARLVQDRIRLVPDWPIPGVQFQDLSGVLADPTAFAIVVDGLAAAAQECAGFREPAIDHVVGIEARGFPYAAALAHHLSAGFVAARKPGKLPGSVHAQAYELEYGTATLELHQDAVGPGTPVVIVDDVLATGGTARAAVDLVHRCDARVVAVLFILSIPGLGGAAAMDEAGVPWTVLLPG